MSLPKPYYQESGITIYNADCREILPHLDLVDLVLTDPPFEQEAHTMQRRLKRSGGVMAIEALPFQAITEEVRTQVSDLISKLCKKWTLTFCQVEGAPIWRKTFEQFGLVYKRTCIWVKPDGMPQYSGDRPGMGYETILAMHGQGRSFWNGGGRHGVFTFNKNDNGGKPNEHPTTKPMRLMLDLVNLFSNLGETVLDPFSGSGPTLRAAKDLGRQAIGIEIEEKYCEIAAKRLRQEVFNFNIPPSGNRGGGGEVGWQS